MIDLMLEAWSSSSIEMTRLRWMLGRAAIAGARAKD